MFTNILRICDLNTASGIDHRHRHYPKHPIFGPIIPPYSDTWALWEVSQFVISDSFEKDGLIFEVSGSVGQPPGSVLQNRFRR